MPADMIGTDILQDDPETGKRLFEFYRGPIFTNLLLADEINRTPPKTQAALLEAMQERQVTVEGQTFPLQSPFHVLATANPIEYEGTYPLPEAQLDRFLLRVSFGYPACPDLEDQAKLFTLLHPEDIGVQLTEGYMMDPEASVSALVFHHPEADYFRADRA
jgi:MoxR-like ATPase